MRAGLFGIAIVLVGASLVAHPPSAAAEDFEMYVGCSRTAQASPSHTCMIGDQPGAFFRARTSVEYEICVDFPSERRLCASGQQTSANELFVNSITTRIPGLHEVTWIVAGQAVGSWSFTMEPRRHPGLPTVLALNDTTSFQERPAEISYTGDGTGVIGGWHGDPASDNFGQLHWKTWVRSHASATGADWLNDCRPDCAEGSFYPHRATVRLSRVRHGHFTQMVVKAKFDNRHLVDRRRMVHTSYGYYSWVIVSQGFR